jgi:hypothetical protein
VKTDDGRDAGLASNNLQGPRRKSEMDLDLRGEMLFSPRVCLAGLADRWGPAPRGDRRGKACKHALKVLGAGRCRSRRRRWR